MDVVKVLDRIAALFDDNAVLNLKELSIVPEPQPDPADPGPRPALRVAAGYVGLSSWALPALYVECKRRLAVAGAGADARLAGAVLAVHPEHGRAWAIRKRSFQPAHAARELAFCALVLDRAPKSGPAWAHRAWILSRVGWDACTELALAEAAAGRAQANYYAGVHRLRALVHADKDVVAEQLEQSRRWLHTHVRDASGWWFHGALLRVSRRDDGFDETKETTFVEDMHARYGKESQCVRQQLRLWRMQVGTLDDREGRGD